ncbi:MAG: hypothetical protein MZV63_40330 [Marinilabiliales bacterium]|nr:hypothetical protein [Marinilabiliales bacterium]
MIHALKRINGNIGDPHYEIQLPFFLRKDLRAQIADIWQMEIELYLEEYFYDQRNRVDEYRWAQIQPEILAEGDE